MNAWRSMRFMQLLLSFWAVILAQAFFLGEHSAIADLVLAVLMLNILLVTLSAANTHKDTRHALLALWCLALVPRLLMLHGHETGLYVFSKACGLLLLLLCTFSLMRYLILRKRITGDLLFAAVVIYMLIALIFSQLYSMADALLPDCFSYPANSLLIDGHLSGVSMNYFSYVTLATLGYGDIAPRHPVVQMLASIEAVIGQFYVAIVVARLVTLHTGPERKS